ncbi:MAG TPA: cupin domain-containing protein [Candidatus Elarobacter sp.]|nr:cupin domain-containing protein [Candidatus Elarobacter sp.]
MAETILDALIAPLTGDDFIDSVWEKAPALLGLRRPDLIRDLASDELLYLLLSRAAGERPAALEILSARDEVAKYSPASASDAFEQFRRGASVRLTGVEYFVRSIGDLCIDLASFCGCAVSSNLYWSPPSSQALAAHLDPHGIFVIQLFGRKAWTVYGEPLDAPLEDGPVLLRYESPWEGQQRLVPQTALPEVAERKPVVIACTLEPGDVLYLPRGTYHRALTCDEHSAHLSVGIHQNSYADLIGIAVGGLSAERLALRGSLPLGFGRVSAAEREAHGRALAILRSLADEAEPNDLTRTFSSLITRSLHKRAVPLTPAVPFDIDAASVLCRRPGTPMSSTLHEGRARLAFGDSALDGALSLSAAFDFIAAHTRFAVHEVPCATPDGALAIVQRLQAAGLLLAPPPSGGGTGTADTERDLASGGV